MPFLIYCIDLPSPERFAIREAHRADHLVYFDKYQRRLIASGGLLDQSGGFVGSCILLDVETLEEAQAFYDGDPFTIAGLRRDVVIRHWVADGSGQRV